ncbi:MAG: Gfo/Idh/MocA family oxidoreductase [Oscillospiraceae bacterium]|jgi:predicted dehydrogenase|nr:Gfo/Idh/MocA family oxidoreductase [Oscillospiraceae bacterium]
MQTVFNWGVIGPGQIAHKFAAAVAAVDNARIISVGGRNPERVGAFADRYGVKKRYDSYAQVACDDDVDAVYVATTHPCHLENILDCLRNKKPVLCEKPLAMNHRQAEKAIACARENNVFLMEAMWTRFLPIYENVGQWIAEGTLGEIHLLQADFGFANHNWGPDERHISLAQGGGALLDLGIYNIMLAFSIFGCTPASVESICHKGQTGVDMKNVLLLDYPDDRLAVLTSAFDARTSQQAVICGTEGYIVIPEYWKASKAFLHMGGQLTQTATRPFIQNGYEYEIMEVMNCVRAGKRESERAPLSHTLAAAKMMTELRMKWGVMFPGEEELS